MEPIVLAAIINGVILAGVAVFQFLANLKLAQMARDVRTTLHQTNSMSERLEKASFVAGKAEGRAEEKATQP